MIALDVGHDRPIFTLASTLHDQTAHILGQERGRKQLAVLLERQDMVRRGLFGQSSGAILAGRSGAGKTYLARTMCKLSGLPFADVNATGFTERGYVGADLPQIFVPLLSAAARMYDEQRGEQGEGNVLARDDLSEIKKVAETGVVILDEFDKWMHRRNHVTGERDTAVQAELLKMVEGSTEFVSDDADELGTEFDSTRVLFICAGAFVGITKHVEKRSKLPGVQPSVREEAYWEHVEPQDFVSYGLLPELAGRLSTHIFLRPLRVEHLTEIMELPGGIIDEYKARFESIGVEWAVPPEGIRQLANMALALGTGARAVETVCWRVFGEALFEARLTGATQVSLIIGEIRARLV